LCILFNSQLNYKKNSLQSIINPFQWLQEIGDTTWFIKLLDVL